MVSPLERALRGYLVAAAALTVLGTADLRASQQSPLNSPLNGRVVVDRRPKDLGTYHVSSGTWSRPSARVNAIVSGASLYDNTCVPGPFISAVDFTNETEMLVDVGQIPSPANTLDAWLPGTVADSYRVNGWRWGICPSEPAEAGGPLVAILSLWEQLDQCLSNTSPGARSVAPTEVFQIPGIPGGGTSNVCYLFNVDIENTSFEFLFRGDGGDGFDGPTAGAEGDTFGVGIQVVRADGQPYTNGVGVALGGDPGSQTTGFGCSTASGTSGPAGFSGESTSFLNPSRHIEGSTGFGNVNDFIDAIDGNLPGCFSFGYFLGFPQTSYVGLHFELYGLPESAPDPFSDYCFGDGGQTATCTPCPCGNEAPAGSGSGCLNASGVGAVLTAAGVPSVAQDSLVFSGAGMSPSSFAILASGASRLPQNATNPCFGLDSGITSTLLDGLRCAGAGVLRHGTRATDSGGSTVAGWGATSSILVASGFTAGQTRHFQSFYRVDPTTGCGRGQNTTQGLTVVIQP